MRWPFLTIIQHYDQNYILDTLPCFWVSPSLFPDTSMSCYVLFLVFVPKPSPRNWNGAKHFTTPLPVITTTADLKAFLACVVYSWSLVDVFFSRRSIPVLTWLHCLQQSSKVNMHHDCLTDQLEIVSMSPLYSCFSVDLKSRLPTARHCLMTFWLTADCIHKGDSVRL